MISTLIIIRGEKCPLRLAFEAREGEWVLRGMGEAESSPSDSRLKRGRGWARRGMGDDRKHPLQLAFEAREGGWV